MITKQQLETNAGDILISINNESDLVRQFCAAWKSVIKPVLEQVKTFTGPEVDKQIDSLIKAADAVCAGNQPDVTNYCNIWHTFHLKALLKAVQIFTGKKVDKVLNKFIEISDSLCP